MPAMHGLMYLALAGAVSSDQPTPILVNDPLCAVVLPCLQRSPTSELAPQCGAAMSTLISLLEDGWRFPRCPVDHVTATLPIFDPWPRCDGGEIATATSETGFICRRTVGDGHVVERQVPGNDKEFIDVAWPGGGVRIWFKPHPQPD